MLKKRFFLSACIISSHLILSACGSGSGSEESSQDLNQDISSSDANSDLHPDQEQDIQELISNNSSETQADTQPESSMAIITSTGLSYQQVESKQNISDGISIETVSSVQGQANTAERIQLEFDALSVDKEALFSNKSTFKDIESYRINTQRLIDFSLEDQSLTITNWIPRDLFNVIVVAEYEEQQIILMQIDTLPGLIRFTIDSPWNMGATQYLTVGGDVVYIEDINTETVQLKFLPQDAVQQEIANIKMQWNIQFPDRVMSASADVCRDGSSVVWRPTRPLDGRYFLSFMIHAAQTVSDAKFYDFWMKTAFQDFDGGIQAENQLTLEEFSTYSEDEKATYDETSLADGYYYNKAHKQKIFDSYTVKKYNLGMTGGGGLGGGSTVGVNHNKINELAWSYNQAAAEAYEQGLWYLPVDDRSYNVTPWNIFGHENGHALGFGHKQTYNVRSQFSHISVGTIVYSGLMHEGRTIITPETMVGRDVDWEKNYVKKADPAGRSRPRCGDAYEWGGDYEKHDFQMPRRETPEWDLYIEAHLEGRGLEYLKELDISPAVYYSWWAP